jgi:hypothetical protein
MKRTVLSALSNSKQLRCIDIDTHSMPIENWKPTFIVILYGANLAINNNRRSKTYTTIVQKINYRRA